MDLYKQLAVCTKEVEMVLEAYLPKEEGYQQTIFEAMNYSMRAGGKRIRPLLMRETFRLFGGEGPVIEPFMAAIEMIHTSSLIHDDLPCMDNDQLRRGLPTTWVRYGYDMAVLAGDALLIYAVETGATALKGAKDPQAVGKAIGLLARKTGVYGMIGGQVVDVELTHQSVSKEKLDFIYRMKTGALLEASMMIGAILAGCDQKSLETVSQIALNVGLAFQIQDDILDVTATAQELGKPVLSDEKNQKTTYVTIKGVDQAAKDVERLSSEAVDLLHTLPGENQFLEQLIQMLVNRKH